MIASSENLITLHTPVDDQHNKKPPPLLQERFLYSARMPCSCLSNRLHIDKFLAFVLAESHSPIDEGKERIILGNADILACIDPRTALPHDYRPCIDPLAPVGLTPRC